MKRVLNLLPALGVILGLALAAVPAAAQQPTKPSPAAVAAAKEILALKSASAMYANAVPVTVQKTKDALIAQNLNYQKDLNEVATVVAKTLAGREKEIGEGMAMAYATQFTEQELKDIVAFYKSPLGQKLISNEPKAIEIGMGFMDQWARNFSEVVMAEFRSEMRKRGKQI